MSLARQGVDISNMSEVETGRTFSTQERKQAAKKGQAKKDGGYPIKNEADLKNAIRAYGRNPTSATKQHIVKRARALGLTKLLPEKWDTAASGGDGKMALKVKPKGKQHCIYDGDREVTCHPDRGKAMVALQAALKKKQDSASDDEILFVECHDPSCERAFLHVNAMFEHAETVHTFNDIQRLIHQALREKYHKRGDYDASPPIPGTWVWTEDVAEDWVVFTVEAGSDTTMYKATYSISEDSQVTLSAPVEVVRRTVYEEVKTGGKASVRLASNSASTSTASN